MATSASQYGSPYPIKEPHPRIIYPSMFSGMRFTFKYMFDSKILALCTLLLGVGFLVTLLMIIMPFWFELEFNSIDGTFGSRPTKTGLTINTGIFFFDEDHFTNLVFLDKYTNEDVVPKVLAFAQVCAILGICILVGCFGAAIILMFRRFASTTGTIFLAAAATLSAVLHLATVFGCAVLVTSSSCGADENCYHDNLAWRMLPMHSQMYRVEPYTTPFVGASFAFYIYAIGCLLVIGAAVMLWIEALITVKNLMGIRYQQLRETRDPYANDVNPMDGKKFVYAPPQRLGPHDFGMQPVVYAAGPLYPPSQAPPVIGFVSGPSQPMYRGGSESGSSMPGGTREIDL